MGTTTGLELDERLSKSICDWISHPVTANIAANTVIQCNYLSQYDEARDRYFENWFIFITSKNNINTERKVRFSYTANAVSNVYGTALSADTATNIADIRVYRYSHASKLRAINDSIRELYPDIFREVDDTTITCNSALYEYNLPTTIQDGEVRQILVNTSALTTTEEGWDRVWNWAVINSGQSIRLAGLFSTGRKLRIIGIAPVNTISNATVDTIPFNGEPNLTLLTAYAKYKLYQQAGSPVSSKDITRYDNEVMKAYGEYIRLLPRGRMTKPATTIKFRGF